MSAIWGRAYRLQVGDDAEVLELDGFAGNAARVAFNVSTFVNSPLALAQITVYGLGRESRRDLYKRYDLVRLTAGYRDKFAMIFDGEIYNVAVGRDGPETFVTLHCRSMGERYDNAYINRTWGNNTPPRDVITDVAATLADAVELVGDFDKLPKMLNGETLSTGSKQAMRSLAQRYDLTWHIDSAGTLVVAMPDAVRNEQPVARIAADTGMIGSPTITQRGIDVRSTMRSDIQPSDVIVVENTTGELAFSNPTGARFSDTIGTGAYQVIGVTHSGDTYADDWSTLLECLVWEAGATTARTTTLTRGQ
ncbi:hypothetical protein [uncultured Halomonas sp.]|uniref:baseplate hub protein n=1 Tax=uncultured Halomonas sp. TaxID=173971 RepID=UPI0026252EA9|nr:hypothetical protein [uncultured Halomonas sp.]